MKTVYILLTRSTSVPSRLIRLFTGEAYTHASIAFDSDLHSLYSFARRHASMPLPAGLVEEHIDNGFYLRQGNIPCAVLALDVSEKEYYQLKSAVHTMLCRAGDYHYSILGLVLCRLSIPLELPHSFFCSQFVAKVLKESCTLDLPKPPALMHPQDFLAMDSLSCLFEGGLCELNEHRANSLLPIRTGA